jgi:hypothetical protein
MAQEPQAINWTEQLVSLGVFCDEPAYHPEEAKEASLHMEQTSPTYRAFKDVLRAKAE